MTFKVAIRLPAKTGTANNCPSEKQRFFNWLADPLAGMATDLGTTQQLMLTMAAKEGGWTTAALNHNQPLNNPFGVNIIKNGRAAGNKAYPTIGAAIQDWENMFGPRVQGAISPADFVKGLLFPKPGQGQPYNSVNPNYGSQFIQVYGTVGKYMGRCGIGG